ncbi:hypothetical protein F4054_07930 [Candidatus Poribacteria bacterium]|nr:hypothetical protein [Candidatus Poribacteria bacterium]MYG06583.1 hypothetical protein [Candidatus Poribacteria bacterium]MYK22174.1 hypothetical protein [Candidatus Poribacteria bacterium]
MKRIGFYCLMLIVFSSVSIWALRGPVEGRTYNRDHHWKSPATNRKYAQCQGSDSDGQLNASASSEVDVEERLEISWPPFRRGIAYSASAAISGAAPNSAYNGYWSIGAYVPNDAPDYKSNEWWGWVDEGASASDFAPRDNIDDVVASSELSSCDASGNIDGGGAWESGSSGSTGPSQQSNYATAIGNW